MKNIQLNWVQIPLHEPFRISSGAIAVKDAIVVQYRKDGVTGWGEASPIKRYKESVDTVEAFCKKVDPRGLSCMTSLQPPTLAQLSQIADVRIYDVGALIGAFIVETWGREALVRLVRANGDVAAVLGVDEATFVGRWMAYTRARYGF